MRGIRGRTLAVTFLLAIVGLVEDNGAETRAKFTKAYRIGEASNPGPNPESPHYRVVGQEELTVEQGLQVTQANAAAERKAFETRVDRITQCLANQNHESHIRTNAPSRAPHDYVKGARPMQPTLFESLLHQISITLSSINITTLDNNIAPHQPPGHCCVPGT